MNFNDLKEKALKLKEQATEKFISIKNKSEEIAKNATNKASELKNKTIESKEKTIEMKDNLVDKATNIKEKAENIKQETTDKTNEIKDKAIETKDKAIEMKYMATEKVTDLKQEATEKKDETIKYAKEKSYGFKTVISSKEEFEFIIKKSATIVFTNQETGEEKLYKHKSIIIFAEEGSEFLKKTIYVMPILITKAFSQNIVVRLVKTQIEGINLADYNLKVENLPSMLIFEEEKVLKVIEGQENILKLVKSFDLDINKLIEEA
ncbi:MAG: hypothetical protein Q8K30_02310 [Candidatus Gracilibacteria bacterium]|nr:hypothetical protein [Candidatus Gracilibacteria bacterium]